VAVADDLGSGALLELEAFAGEPTVAASLRAGVDVVCFSGDKLLGGPQAGILLGRSGAIDRLRKHPVARALRLDKMTLAALEATLLLYADPERARRDIPTLRFLSRTPAETAALAVSLQAAIERRCAEGFIFEVEGSSARAGGGSMPLAELPSHAVRMRIPEPPTGADIGVPRATRLSASALEAELRRAPIPVVARVSQDSLHLDVLALDEGDIEAVAESVSWAAERVVAAAGAGRPAPGPDH
jgi:L-seryl-tRNA(Ser) seleniumtransferase